MRQRVIGRRRVSVTLELKEGELNTLDITQELAFTLCDEVRVLYKKTSKKDPSIIVAGLGNRNITPDSHRAKVVETMIITRHAITDKSLQLELDDVLEMFVPSLPGAV